jgi:taurine-pyruvate aminotransferase
MDASLTHVLDYGVDDMIGGDREHLWHHIKPHNCFQSQEQMIIVSGKGLTVTDIRGRDYTDATSGGSGASMWVTAGRVLPTPSPLK